MEKNREDRKKIQAVLEKLTDLINHRYGELVIKVHDGDVRQVELVKRASTIQQIEDL